MPLQHSSDHTGRAGPAPGTVRGRAGRRTPAVQGVARSGCASSALQMDLLSRDLLGSSLQALRHNLLKFACVSGECRSHNGRETRAEAQGLFGINHGPDSPAAPTRVRLT